ncbi:basic proline-rich protein-like [Eublepharis macularius]|uniref:Basic proline-rich protein-like n=1 Tax=Eublepharis macularius TaxID=481883 RepID=A0AA97LKF6_EUBMA|nr:basic proline-rich protein-like [Eublepharis macularius]
MPRCALSWDRLRDPDLPHSLPRTRAAAPLRLQPGARASLAPRRLRWGQRPPAAPAKRSRPGPQNCPPSPRPPLGGLPDGDGDGAGAPAASLRARPLRGVPEAETGGGGGRSSRGPPAWRSSPPPPPPPLPRLLPHSPRSELSRLARSLLLWSHGAGRARPSPLSPRRAAGFKKSAARLAALPASAETRAAEPATGGRAEPSVTPSLSPAGLGEEEEEEAPRERSARGCAPAGSPQPRRRRQFLELRPKRMFCFKGWLPVSRSDSEQARGRREATAAAGGGG